MSIHITFEGGYAPRFELGSNFISLYYNSKADLADYIITREIVRAVIAEFDSTTKTDRHLNKQSRLKYHPSSIIKERRFPHIHIDILDSEKYDEVLRYVLEQYVAKGIEIGPNDNYVLSQGLRQNIERNN